MSTSNFKSYISSSIGTSNTTIFTATATATTVIGCSLANITTLPVLGNVYITKSGGGSAYIIKNAPIPSGGTLVIIGSEQKVVLQTGDSLSFSSNTASSIDAIVSTLELS